MVDTWPAYAWMIRLTGAITQKPLRKYLKGLVLPYLP